MTAPIRILAESAPIPARHVCAFAFEPRVPPKEIQLWNSGDNPTDYGVHKWTARSAADVIGRYESRGNPLLIDVEHNGANKEGVEEPPVTGGYARLELRAGAPWLVFDWSAYAVEQITTGQRRFLSPEYDVDNATGEILALYRVSLVGDPGTHRARMLASAQQQETGMDPKLAAIMAILSSVTDPAAAIEAIKSLVASLDGAAAPAGDAAGGDAGGDAGGAMAAAGDPPAGGDAKDPDKDKVAAAAKPAASAPAAAASPPAASAAPATTPAAATGATEATKVETVAAAAVVQIENAQRDHMIATSGERLEPSIRRWASTQPLAVVRGLIGAAPAKLDPPGRIAATRGDTQGQAAPGLQGKDLEELQKSMGTFKASAPEPHTTPAGVLVLPSVTPSAHRERKRVAAAAAAVAAGKVGT